MSISDPNEGAAEKQHTPNVGIDTAVSGAIETIRENVKLAEVNRQYAENVPPKVDSAAPVEGDVVQERQPAKPKWHNYPKSLYKTDAEGNVLIHKKGRHRGKPVLKNPFSGRPRAAKPGEELAGGGIAGEATRVSRVVDPLADGPTPAGDEQPKQGAEGVSLGPEAGRLIADAINNLVGAVAGDDARMTNDERNSIGDAASATFHNKKVAALVAFLVFTSFWGARVVFVRYRAKRDAQPNEKQQQRSTNERHPQSDSREIQVRQDGPGTADRGDVLDAWG